MADKKFKLVKNGYGLFKIKNKFLHKIAKECDDYGYVSEELGRELQNLWDDNYAIGIHRTAFTDVNEVFTNGLINGGSINQGANYDGINSLEKTVSIFPHFLTFFQQIKASDNYVDYFGAKAKGCFIIKIPKSYLGYEEGDVKPIYFLNDVEQRLLPEFIYGYVPVKDGVCGDLIKNPNYKDFHDYETDGLAYEPDAMFLLEKSGKSI